MRKVRPDTEVTLKRSGGEIFEIRIRRPDGLLQKKRSAGSPKDAEIAGL